MTTNIKLPWIKILGWAILIHVILIVLSILEVVVYSTIVNTGHEQSFYEQHAQTTAPYISIIFGIVLFFFISRLLVKKRYDKRQAIGLVLPIAYIIIDIIIMQLSDTDWGQQYFTFIISFVTKILASYVGAIMVSKNE